MNAFVQLSIPCLCCHTLMSISTTYQESVCQKLDFKTNQILLYVSLYGCTSILPQHLMACCHTCLIVSVMTKHWAWQVNFLSSYFRSGHSCISSIIQVSQTVIQIDLLDMQDVDYISCQESVQPFVLHILSYSENKQGFKWISLSLVPVTVKQLWFLCL